MYQVFNVKKNRWQKFDKNGKLLGTKRTEGPYLKIPQKSEETLQQTEEIPQKSEETLQQTEEILQETEEILQEIEEIPQTKTMDEWLSDEKMELISDNGILLQNGLNLKSKFSKEKYDELLPKLAVRHVL